MLKSFLFDPDSGLLLFFSRFVDFMWLSILTVVCSVPVVTAGAAVSACLYCCRKMILHEDAHLTKKFFQAYKENMKKGILLEIIMLDIFLVLGGFVLIIMYGEKIFNISVQVPMPVSILLTFLILVCSMALMHVFPLNAYFENSVLATLKNSFLVAFSDLPVTIALLVVNLAPVFICYNYPVFLIVEAFFGVGFCAFCTAQLYRKIMKKLGVSEDAQNGGEDEKGSGIMEKPEAENAKAELKQADGEKGNGIMAELADKGSGEAEDETESAKAVNAEDVLEKENVKA